MTIEATGTQEKLAALIAALEPFGGELVQSGVVAIGRGPRSISTTQVRGAERAS